MSDVVTASAAPDRAALAARRAAIEGFLRGGSAHYDPLTDVWRLHTVRPARGALAGRLIGGYLEVLLDDETGAVQLIALDTYNRLRWSTDLDGSVDAPTVVEAICQAQAR